MHGFLQQNFLLEFLLKIKSSERRLGRIKINNNIKTSKNNTQNYGVCILKV